MAKKKKVAQRAISIDPSNRRLRDAFTGHFISHDTNIDVDERSAVITYRVGKGTDFGPDLVANDIHLLIEVSKLPDRVVVAEYHPTEQRPWGQRGGGLLKVGPPQRFTDPGNSKEFVDFQIEIKTGFFAQIELAETVLPVTPDVLEWDDKLGSADFPLDIELPVAIIASTHRVVDEVDHYIDPDVPIEFRVID